VQRSEVCKSGKENGLKVNIPSRASAEKFPGGATEKMTEK